jgi:hypothetical protein
MIREAQSGTFLILLMAAPESGTRVLSVIRRTRTSIREFYRLSDCRHRSGRLRIATGSRP